MACLNRTVVTDSDSSVMDMALRVTMVAMRRRAPTMAGIDDEGQTRGSPLDGVRLRGDACEQWSGIRGECSVKP